MYQYILYKTILYACLTIHRLYKYKYINTIFMCKLYIYAIPNFDETNLNVKLLVLGSS